MGRNPNQWLREQVLLALEETGTSQAELARRMGGAWNRHKVYDTLRRLETMDPRIADEMLGHMGRRLDFIVRDDDESIATTDQSEAQRSLLRVVLDVLPRLSDSEAHMLQELVTRFAPKDVDQAPE